jgi:hypothetical protein
LVDWETLEPKAVTDIRGREEEFDLDSHGFKFLSRPTSFTQWSDRRAVEGKYLPEVEALIKDTVERVDEVQIFDWRVNNHVSSRSTPLPLFALHKLHPVHLIPVAKL